MAKSNARGQCCNSWWYLPGGLFGRRFVWMVDLERRNLITDVPGLVVGNAHDAAICSGVSVVIPDGPAVASIDVRGGGPGTRESDALGPDGVVEHVHGIVLSGGSAFGLSASSGVQSWLRDKGIGFSVGAHRVPIVPQAILFDLNNGGNKDWSGSGPYEALAIEACRNASSGEFATGSVGAGYGAMTANLRGGLGSCSSTSDDGIVVGALVAVNALGRVTMGATRHFHAYPFERDAEFGGHGAPAAWDWRMGQQPLKGERAGESTTIALVATNAKLNKAEARRVAIMAQTGMARAIHPVHSPLDGDCVFVLSTGLIGFEASPGALAKLGSTAADTLSRAIARGVYEAASVPEFWTGPGNYRSVFRENEASA